VSCEQGGEIMELKEILALKLTEVEARAALGDMILQLAIKDKQINALIDKVQQSAKVDK